MKEVMIGDDIAPNAKEKMETGNRTGEGKGRNKKKQNKKMKSRSESKTEYHSDKSK